MSNAEVVAYRYGQRMEAVEAEHGPFTETDDIPAELWFTEAERRAVERLGLRRFNEWLQAGRTSQAGP